MLVLFPGCCHGDQWTLLIHHFKNNLQMLCQAKQDQEQRCGVVQLPGSDQMTTPLQKL